MTGPKKVKQTNHAAALELELALDDLVPRLGIDTIDKLAETMTPLQRSFVLNCARNLRELAKLLEQSKKANG